MREFEASRDRAQFDAARNFLRQGNLKACRESVEQLLTRNPKFIEARFVLADLMLDEEDYEGAEDQMRDVLAARPNDAHAEHTLGIALDGSGNVVEAAAALSARGQAGSQE